MTGQFMSDKITLQRDNERDLRFQGDLIASARNWDDRAMGAAWSGQTGSWEQFYLYETTAGKYVCHAVHYTRWQGETDRYSGQVCTTADEVFEFFGSGTLAKEICEEAGLDVVEEVV
jgi:hypothetical protein